MRLFSLRSEVSRLIKNLFISAGILIAEESRQRTPPTVSIDGYVRNARRIRTFYHHLYFGVPSQLVC
jgi:hypothetical protein